MCTAVQAGTSSMQQEVESADEPPLFATTSSFTTIHGFVVPKAPPAVVAVLAEEALRALHSSSSNSSSSEQPTSGLRVRVPSCSEKCGAAVGWTGLLESSRAGGSSGVMGSVEGGSGSGPSGHIEVCCTTHTTPGVRRLVKAVVRGLKACQEPERAPEGMGGTYFFCSEAGRKVAILKPCDEEPLAPHNPKGYVGRALGDPGWKPTVRVGEAAMREVAAYLLDHDHFAKVPHTVLVRAQHPILHYNPLPAAPTTTTSSSSSSAAANCSMLSSEGGAEALEPASSNGPVSNGGAAAPGASKLGSLQEFVYHIADTSEMGTQRLSTRDVHHIGILDVRLFNTDRHAGNMLVRLPGGGGSGSSTALGPGLGRLAEGCYEVIPIDHGFCLPEALEAPYFEWLHWPQALLPFCQEDLDYIARLDVQADIELLRRELPALRPECLRVLEVSTTLLQRCAAAGLALADIGGLMSRPLDLLEEEDGLPSELEKACVAARQAMETRLLAASSCSSASMMELREEDEDALLEQQEEEEAGQSEEGQGVEAGQLQAAHGDMAMQLLATSLGQVTLGPEVGRQLTPDSLMSVDGPCGERASSTTLTDTSNSSAATAVLRRGMSGEGVGGGVEPDLLFDLDEDGSASGSSGRRASCELAPLSPYGSGMSLESAGSGQLGEGRLAPTSRLGGGAGGTWGAPHGTSAAPLAMASSLYSTGPVLWHGRAPARPFKPGGAAGGSAVKKPRLLAGGRRGIAAAVAPLVVAAPPRAVSEVLSSMTGEQWELFMEELGRVMEEALAGGAWCRQVPSSGGAAASCPRF